MYMENLQHESLTCRLHTCHMGMGGGHSQSCGAGTENSSNDCTAKIPSRAVRRGGCLRYFTRSV